MLSVKKVENITYQDIDIGWAILNLHTEVNLWQKRLLLPSAYGENFYFFLFCVYDHYRFKTDNTDLPVIFHLMPSGISICNEPIYNEVLGINEQYCPPQ